MCCCVVLACRLILDVEEVDAVWELLMCVIGVGLLIYLLLDVGVAKRGDLEAVPGVVWGAGVGLVVRGVGVGLAGVVPLTGVDSGDRGRKSKGVEGTLMPHTDEGVREKLNFGGSTSFLVKVRDLLKLTVDLREERLGSSKGIGADDGLGADLSESLFLRRRFKGVTQQRRKKGNCLGSICCAWGYHFLWE